MITIQRVRVTWSAAARGASHANARRGLCRPVILPPSLPADDVVIHDVLAEEPAQYARRDNLVSGGVERARGIGLWLSSDGAGLVVERMLGRAAYPRQSGSARLFTLTPGQMGQYRANFRFIGCACDPSWQYEDWLVRVVNGEVSGSAFVDRVPDHDVDHRVHLYGGSRRSAAQRRSTRQHADRCMKSGRPR